MTFVWLFSNLTAMGTKPINVAKLRERLGLTQEELAEMLGVHQVTISKWELGKRNISRMARKALERIKQEAA